MRTELQLLLVLFVASSLLITVAMSFQTECAASGKSCTVPGNTVTDSSVELNSGHHIPVFALGVYQSEPGETTYKAVLQALRMGYRHIDTAALYRNEEDVGRAVRDSQIPREEIFVTTKLWNLSLKDGEDGYTFAKAEAAKSLEKLNIGYIDLYLIHSPHNPSERMEMWRAMEELVGEGTVRSIGVSNYGVHHIQEVLEQGTIPPAVNQIELHPFLLRDEIAEFCAFNTIRVEAYSPLAKAQKFGHPVLLAMAKKYNKSEAQILIRWSLQRGYIALPKSVNPGRIKENANVFNFGLNEKDMAALDGLDEHFTTGWDPTEMA
jgi:diketogulonate reductase-like aldo/keto reductase